MKTEYEINSVYEIRCEIVRTSTLDKLVDASNKWWKNMREQLKLETKIHRFTNITANSDIQWTF